MNAIELLQALERRGVTLFVEGDSLRFRAVHPGSYTTADRAAVAVARPELLQLLAPAKPESQQKNVEGWDQGRAKAVIEDLIDLRDAFAFSADDDLWQRRYAAGDEVDRCWIEKDMAGLLRAAQAFADLFNMFSPAMSDTVQFQAVSSRASCPRTRTKSTQRQTVGSTKNSLFEGHSEHKKER